MSFDQTENTNVDRLIAKNAVNLYVRMFLYHDCGVVYFSSGAECAGC